jgi:hypothetical protein
MVLLCQYLRLTLETNARLTLTPYCRICEMIIDLTRYFLTDSIALYVPVTVQTLHLALLKSELPCTVIALKCNICIRLVVDTGVFHTLRLQLQREVVDILLCAAAVKSTYASENLVTHIVGCSCAVRPIAHDTICTRLLLIKKDTEHCTGLVVDTG